jgi:hypothetical protein
MANKQQQKATPAAKRRNPNKVEHLTLDQKNANKHSQYGTGLLENSVREAGFGRSILISNDDVVIAGNGTVEAAAAIGMEKVKVVETDGTEIIAVKRTDIKSGTAAFHRMALADNIVASKNIVMDAEVVEALVEEYGTGEDNVKFWANIVLEPVDPERLADPDKANTVQATFQLSSVQAGALNKAIKISKQLNKTKFEKQDNTNSNGNALFFIIDHYLKQHGHVKVDEGEGKGQKPADKKPFVSREEGGKARRENKRAPAKKSKK